MLLKARGSGAIFGGGRGRTRDPNSISSASPDGDPRSESQQSQQAQSSASYADMLKIVERLPPSSAFDGDFDLHRRILNRDVTESEISQYNPDVRRGRAGDPTSTGDVRTRRSVDVALFEETPRDHHRDPDVISHSDSSPNRFAPPPRLGSDGQQMQRRASPPETERVAGVLLTRKEADDGFVRGAAPTLRMTDAPSEPTAHQLHSHQPLTVTSVERRHQAVESPARAPRLRTAERMRMSDHEKRHTVAVTSSVTAQHAILEAQIDRLTRELGKKDVHIDSLEAENRRLTDVARDAQLQFGALQEQFKQCHESLRIAYESLKVKQRQIEQLQMALVGESTDNDVLRDGFVQLLRNANDELRYLKEQIALRERNLVYTDHPPRLAPGVGSAPRFGTV